MVTGSEMTSINESGKSGAHIPAGKLIAGVCIALAAMGAQAQQSEPDGYAGATSANYQEAATSTQWDTAMKTSCSPTPSS